MGRWSSRLHYGWNVLRSKCRSIHIECMQLILKGLVNYNFFGDISMLFYLVNAVIIGYMAGALNNGSTNFKRMLGAGLTAAIITAVIQAYMNYNCLT